MELNDFQKRCMETAIYPHSMRIVGPALGLSGETGEVCDKIKKVLRDYGGLFTEESRQEIAKEIGDVMWYCAALSKDLGFSLQEIADLNYEKLKSRKERGTLNGNGDNR